MNIVKNAVVSMNYRLFDEQGALLDSSDSGGPLVYLQGAQDLIPGLENAMEGHAEGDSLSVSVAPEEAYGERDPALIDSVPRENFPGIETIEAGMQFQTEMEDGTPMVVSVVEVTDTAVVVDGNHPLAGTTLNFEVEVLEIREATETEIAHGHVHQHGDGHC